MVSAINNEVGIPLLSLVFQFFTKLTRRCLYYFTSLNFLWITVAACHKSPLACFPLKGEEEEDSQKMFCFVTESAAALRLSGYQKNNDSWHFPRFLHLQTRWKYIRSWTKNGYMTRKVTSVEANNCFFFLAHLFGNCWLNNSIKCE